MFVIIVSAGRYAGQQQCGVDNLPAFGDRTRDSDYLGSPRTPDRLQTIIPAYTFDCAGRVTEWRACVDSGASSERYYIQFQVWRPTGVPGCYTLVGYNAPQPPMYNQGSPTFISNWDQMLQPADRCVLLVVSEGEEIEFQPGDVIGYYVDRFDHNGRDHDDGTLQLVSDQNVVAYNITDVPLDDLKTQYAIPALGSDPSFCGFELEGSDSNLFQMTSSIAGAPIVSLSLATIVVTSGIQSDGILFPTPTVPEPKPTSDGVRSSSSASVNDSGGGTGCVGECSDSTGPSNLLPVIVGVACALLVLVTAAVIIIAVLVYLRKRKKTPDVVDNVAYISGTREETRDDNRMPSEGKNHIFTSANEAYDTSENIVCSEGKNYIFTSTNEAYGTSTEMYVVTDVPTNPTYQAAPCQSRHDSFIYDYPRPE